jgi:hypothetical protein
LLIRHCTGAEFPDWRTLGFNPTLATSRPRSSKRWKSPTAATIEIPAMASTPGMVIKRATTGSASDSIALLRTVDVVPPPRPRMAAQLGQ